MTDHCRQCAKYLAEINRLQAVNRGYYDNLTRLIKNPHPKASYWPDTTTRIRVALSIPAAQAAVLDVLYHDPTPVHAYDLTARIHPSRVYYHDGKVAIVHVSQLNGHFKATHGKLVVNIRREGYVLSDAGRELLDKIFK